MVPQKKVEIKSKNIMKHTYTITGMTCNGCVQSVKEKLLALEDVTTAEISLERQEAVLTMANHVPLEALRKALPEKYTLAEKYEMPADNPLDSTTEISKWKQLQPLFLIFLYLFSSAVLLHINSWSWRGAMLDFMGLFYIVFSFFKFLDLKGFPDSFRMYDPLAKLLPIYAWVYPFLELALGLMFLFRFQIPAALIATIVLLGITTVGVSRTLLDKKAIRCACLGTALKLPMTEATFIENAIMLVMAVTMLIQIL
jgi:copper chaperone CopZ